MPIWILTLFLLHPESAVVTKVEGLESHGSCAAAGKAWLAAVNKREASGDIAFFQCVQAPPTPATPASGSAR
jgi:hypothetical protein